MTDIRIPMTYHLILASSAMATTYESYKVAEIPAPYVGIKRAPCALRLTMIDRFDLSDKFGGGMELCIPHLVAPGGYSNFIGD